MIKRLLTALTVMTLLRPRWFWDRLRLVMVLPFLVIGLAVLVWLDFMDYLKKKGHHAKK